MRRSCFIILLLIVGLIGVAGPASAAPGPNYNLSWAAIDPGDDWSARVILSIFPVIPGPAGTDSTGSASTVIGTLLGTVTGYVAAIAMAWVCYGTIMQIFRGAETARMLDRNMSAMFLVRMGMAAILMVPQASGFSGGQWIAVKTALWGAGLAKSFYAVAVEAIGPDAMVIAQPIIPGTKTIVAGLIRNEMCRSLINAASAQPDLAPLPKPVQNIDSATGGYVTWSYYLSSGNATGSPACGTVTLRNAKTNATNIAGVSVDMTGMQRDVLTKVLTNDIRPVVEKVAAGFWQTKRTSELTPLLGALTAATADYTAQLTAAATRKTAELRNALQNSAEARKGNVGLIDNQVKLSSLGWTQAAAYYLEFSRLNGQTLSLVSATPTTNTPTYEGLGSSLTRDLAPLQASSEAFMHKLMTYVQTTDGLDMPGGNSDLFSGATPGEDGAGTVEQLFRSLRLNDRLLNLFLEGMSPVGNMWTDPFSAVMQLGHKMVTIALTAMGLAGLLNSNLGTAAAAGASIMSGNIAGVGGALVGHAIVGFFAGPIFLLCMAILLPALTIAFVLPFIPWLTFYAGVIGWLILVCEAVIAVPFAMLGHMTFAGEGLHGRAREFYGLLFSILTRPTLMIVGLFLGGFIFTAGSWLTRQGFGVMAGFILANGWLVTNVLGVAVMLIIYVLTHTVTALLSFRMIAIVPHHVTRLAGFGSANRVDMEQFGRDAALIGAVGGIRAVENAARGSMRSIEGTNPSLGFNGQGLLTGSNGQRADASADKTLRAATDVPTERSQAQET